MKTGIYRLPKGGIVDITRNAGNPLVWNENSKKWGRVNASAPVNIDLSKAVEMTAEDIIRVPGLCKITPVEE